MRTNRHPMDYKRRQKPPSPEIRAREQTISDFAGDLLRFERRGLITHDEFLRLMEKGPGESAIVPCSKDTRKA